MTSPDVRPASSSGVPDPSGEELEKLRKLLLGPDYEQALQTMLSQSDTERVADTLSEAIIQRNLRDKSISEALGPIIDEAISHAIRNKPHRITSVIYPIIGPSIRKSVARALADLVQSLNQILESSLSLRAWGWRFSAWRAGISYGEYVLLKTLDFRVEQVLLIHRQTGILLHAEHAAGVNAEDPELVSSMLTAISDFISDSFTSAGHPQAEIVDNIQVGDFILEIESGPAAIIAAAVRGNPTDGVRKALRQALERVHLVFSRDLDDFEGDRAIFAAAAEILQPCLMEQRKKTATSRTPWLALIAITLGVGYAGLLSYQRLQADRVHHQITQILRETPDYIILTEDEDYPRLRYKILRSPQSATPDQVLATVDHRPWQLDIDTDIAAVNLGSYLLPLLPETFGLDSNVDLSIADNSLIIKGELSPEIYARIQSSPLLQSAFTQIDLSQVQIAQGPSEKQQQLAQWKQLKADIGAINIMFQPNTAELMPGEEDKIPDLIAKIKAAELLAKQIPVPDWQIYIIGHASVAGTDQANLKISEVRAKVIRNLLVENEVPGRNTLAWGAGHLPDSLLPNGQQRMVTFQLLHSPLATGETELP